MATQHGAHPRKKLAGAEGLGEVVVGAQLEAEDAVDLLALGGKHDDRNHRLGADFPREGEPVLAGQAHVEEHQVDAAGSERFAHVAAVRRRDHLELVPDEIVADHLPGGGVVVDGEDPLLHRKGDVGRGFEAYAFSAERKRGARFLRP